MAGWLKSGLIFSVISFLCAAVFSWLIPLCLLPISLIIGLLSGIATALWDKNPDTRISSREGAKSGLMCGITTLIITILGGGIYFYFYGQQNSENIMKLFGQNSPAGSDKAGFLVGGFATLACCGVTNLLIYVGCAALGAYLISRFFIKKAETET